jgi:hypothetical protein
MHWEVDTARATWHWAGPNREGLQSCYKFVQLRDPYQTAQNGETRNSRHTMKGMRHD